MPKEFKLPDLGEGLQEATLVAWKVKEGDFVQADQTLAEVETDKALAELPSPFAGKIARLHFKNGDAVPVGAVLVTFEAGENKARPRAAERAKPQAAAMKKTTVETERPRVLAAPATRRMARERGIDIGRVTGTGPGGRVTAEDILSYASSPSHKHGKPPFPEALPATEIGDFNEAPAAIQRPMLPDFSQWGQVERQKASPIRRRIAQRLTISVQTAANVTHMDEADVTALEENRVAAQAAARDQGVRLTLLPYLLKVLVAVLQKRPIFNASYDDDKQEIVFKKYFHIGVAVDSPQGLLVPVLRDADRKSLVEAAREIVQLADKARDGKLSADEMRGGSFTVTNIGVIGGLAFTPIINWPEVAILGLGRIHERPALRNGVLVNRKMLPLMLTFDHRLIDGAEAARFMNDVKQHLENPLLLLLEER